MKLKDQIVIAKRNLKLVMLESALTAALLSMSIMTPFFYSIGLSQLQISQTQVIFTVVMMFLNLPTGWIGDWQLARTPLVVLLCFAPVGLFLTFQLARE